MLRLPVSSSALQVSPERPPTPPPPAASIEVSGQRSSGWASLGLKGDELKALKRLILVGDLPAVEAALNDRKDGYEYRFVQTYLDPNSAKERFAVYRLPTGG